MKDKKMLLGIGIAFLFLATISFTYAYFSTSIKNDSVKNQVVTTGTLELTYTDGPEVIMTNIKPGTSLTKEVSVKNTGTLEVFYDLVWQELTNGISNYEMVMSATCERRNNSGTVEGTCEGVASTAIEDNNIKKNITIESGVTHKYVITITFKETNRNQNYNQGKKFSGVLGINESDPSKIVKTTYCTYDGTVSGGTNFTNGIYIYNYDSYEYGGWRVRLTEEAKASTESISDVPCTFINNEPVISMAEMFSGSNAVSIDASKFDTSFVQYMNSMFSSMSAITIDVSNFKTSNVTRMDDMFGNNTNLKTIYANGDFDTTNVIRYDGSGHQTMFIFSGSENLVGGNGTSNKDSYWPDSVDVDYARIDTESTPGFFTLKNN